MGWLTREQINDLDLIVVGHEPIKPSCDLSLRFTNHQGTGRMFFGDDVLFVHGAVFPFSEDASLFPQPLVSFSDLLLEKTLVSGHSLNRIITQTELVANVQLETVAAANSENLNFLETNASTKGYFFDTPFEFQPDKRLMFARSPNAKVALPSNLLRSTTYLQEDLLLGSYVYYVQEGVGKIKEVTCSNRKALLSFISDPDLITKYDPLTIDIYKTKNEYLFVTSRSGEDANFYSLPGSHVFSSKDVLGLIENIQDLDKIDHRKFKTLFDSGWAKAYRLIYENPTDLLSGKKWMKADYTSGSRVELTLTTNTHFVRSSSS